MTRGETGLVELIAGNRVPNTPHFAYDESDPPTWATLRDAVGELINEDHPYKRLVIDTANGAEILCQEHVRKTQFKNSHAAFASYGKGWEACRVQWLGLLQDLDELRSRRKMAITLLAHTKVKKFDDPTQDESYDKYTPACQEKLWDLTHKWSDIICFGHFKTEVYETDSGKTKANKDVKRVICFNQSPTWEAGNRYGIAGEIDVNGGAQAGYKLFEAAVAKARATNAHAPQVSAEEGRKRVAAANTLEELGKVWASLTAPIQKELAADKDRRKAELSQPTPSTTTPQPPAPQAQTAAPEPEDRGDAYEGPDVHPDDDGINEPPPVRTMPGAERRTAPNPRIEARDYILSTMGEINVTWPDILNDAGKAQGVASLCGIEREPDLKIAHLNDDQMLRLRDWVQAQKAKKDARKRKPKAEEQEAA